MVTFCAEVYVPGGGEKSGVATVPGGVIVYLPLCTALAVMPDFQALAFRVFVAAMDTGPV